MVHNYNVLQMVRPAMDTYQTNNSPNVKAPAAAFWVAAAIAIAAVALSAYAD